jgi:hypothetical protein
MTSQLGSIFTSTPRIFPRRQEPLIFFSFNGMKWGGLADETQAGSFFKSRNFSVICQELSGRIEEGRK